MSDRLTPQREAEIAARAEAATPGPWEAHEKYGAHFYAYLGGPYLRGVGTFNFGEGDDAEADKALTVNAREDIRALLAELVAVRAERDAFRDQRNNVFETNAQLHAKVTEAFEARLRAENETRTARREARDLHARVAELEKAAEEIRFLHKDSPMGPCPVCVDADAWARGDDPTVPYPCPTARLAGAKDCDPPSHRTARES